MDSGPERATDSFLERGRALDARSIHGRVTVGCALDVRRGPRGTGIAVDPARVRQARLEAGLSLAQVAGDDVSRTFLHFVEHGRSRPSKAILALIAKRTGRPLNYFLAPAPERPELSTALATDLNSVAFRIRQLIDEGHLTIAEHEAMRLVQLTLRQGARLASAIEGRSSQPKRSSAARLTTSTKGAS